MLLNRQQSLVYQQQHITFNDSAGVRTTLNTEQFFNFDDIVCAQPLLHYGSYPLGDNLWFNLRTLAFSSSKPEADFRFQRHSWHNYLRRAHYKAVACMKHAERESYQSDAYYETCGQGAPKSRRLASRIGRQALSWPTSHASG